jgi:hypothetical protein
MHQPFGQIRILILYNIFPLKKILNLERTRYIRSERKTAAQYYHQAHSADTLLTVEGKAKRQNMFSCKSLIILLLLIAVSAGQSHNYAPCTPRAGDTLLRSESSARSFKFLKRVSETVSINVGDKIIGCVQAIDKWGDGTGGFAEITRGGMGYNYVDVKITSQLNRGFWFVVDVYGQ